MAVVDDSDFADLEALNVISKLYFEGLIYDASTGPAEESADRATTESTPGLASWLSDTSLGGGGDQADVTAEARSATTNGHTPESHEEQRDAPPGWADPFEDLTIETAPAESAPIAAGAALAEAPVIVASSIEVELAAEPASEQQGTESEAPPEAGGAPLLEAVRPSGTVLPFRPSAPADEAAMDAAAAAREEVKAPERAAIAKLALRRVARPATANDLLQPVAGETAEHTTAQPTLTAEPERVVLSDTLLADLSASRPAEADAAREFDDPSLTPLPKPMPPDSRANELSGPNLDAWAATAVESAQHLDDEDDMPREGIPRGILFGAVAGLVVIVFGAALALSGTKPPPPKVSATPTPTVSAAPNLPPPSPAATPNPAAVESNPATPTPPVAAVPANPAVDTTKPTDTTKPATDTTKPVVATASDTTKPATDATKPVVAAALDATKGATQPAAAPEAVDYAALVEEGKALYKRGQLKKAIEKLEAAVAAKPDGDEALVVLANCYLDRGSAVRALEKANAAVAANAENADGYLVIGAVQQQNGKNVEAKKAYETYLKLAPKGQYASEIRSILSSL